MSSESPSVVALIPARYASSRLAGKTLLKETGKYLIQHVYERVSQAGLVEQVIIAADDERIVDAALSFGAEAVMTSPEHRSGTDRIAEACRDRGFDIILNVQGDEPEIEPEAVDQLAEMLIGDPQVPMATLAIPIAHLDRYLNPNVVKVVVDNSGDALYFSRAPIPNGGSSGISLSEMPVTPLHHMGIYGFRSSFLQKFVSLPQGKLEQIERLEQLRVLEHGYRIRVGLRATGRPGIDTPEQYREFVQRWKASSKA